MADNQIYNYTPLDIFAPIQYSSPTFDPYIDISEKLWLLTDPREETSSYGDYFFSIESIISPIIVFSRTTYGGSKDEVVVSDQQLVGSPVPSTYSDSSGINPQIFKRTYRARLLPALWDVDIYPQLSIENSGVIKELPIIIPPVSPIGVTIVVRNDTTGSKNFPNISVDGCSLNPDQTIPDGSLTLYINGPTKYETFVIENAEDYPPYRKLSIENEYKVNYLASDNKGVNFRSLSVACQIIKDITYIQYLPECLLRISITDSLNNVPDLLTIVVDGNVLSTSSPNWYGDNTPYGSVVIEIPEKPIPPPVEPSVSNDLIDRGFSGWPGLNPSIPRVDLDLENPENTATIQMVVFPLDILYTIQKTNDTRPAREFKGNLIFFGVGAGEYTITGYQPDIESKKLINSTKTFSITKDEKKIVSLRFINNPYAGVPYLS